MVILADTLKHLPPGRRFPAHAARPLRDDPLAPARRALAGARILLADDHPLNQDVAREMLEDAGATVCVANDGAEAIELLRHARFDCVLMDVQMPGVDGLEATRRIRAAAELAHLPVIAMTASTWNQDRARCLAAGMDDFIGKPVDVRVFYPVVAKWVRSGRRTARAGTAGGFDLAALAASTSGDAAKMRRVALKFIATTRDDLPRLEAAAASGDLETLRALGHRIKAPARAVGAHGFADLCLALEGVGDGSAARARDIVGRLRPMLDGLAGAWAGEAAAAHAA